jgi:hypothetical protein
MNPYWHKLFARLQESPPEAPLPLRAAAALAAGL